MKGKKKQQLLKYDELTEFVRALLRKIPRIGSLLSRLYMWKNMMFNFMLIGASGLVLSWALYEGIFRNLLLNIWGGTFWAMMITTLLVFFWNYFWNWRFSLSIEAQVASMKKPDLLELQERVKAVLSQEFDHKGERLHE